MLFRSPQVLGAAGNLWISGVLDVAGPTSSGMMIPGTQQTTGFMSSDSVSSRYSGNLVLHEGVWKHGSEFKGKSKITHDSIDKSLLHEEKSPIKIPSSLHSVKSAPLNSGIGKSTWEDEGTP